MMSKKDKKIYDHNRWVEKKEILQKQCSEWQKNNREKCRGYTRKCYKKNSKKRMEYNRKYKEKFFERFLARTALNNAVSKGVIKKPKNCSLCGKENVKIQGHHSDYEKPFFVAWVCPPCHAKIHKERIP